MPTSNPDCPSDAKQAYASDLSEFFGGAWDFAPNGTFSDVADPPQESVLPDPVPEDPMQKHRSPVLSATSNQSIQAPASSSSPSVKTKPPNLYEALRRSQMMAPMMMTMSPLAGYSDGMMGNMDWTLDASGNIFPTSPSLLGTMDPTQMMMMQAARMKRPRVSPFMSPAGLDFGMGMNMFRRSAKMPLSPITRPSGERTALETNDKTMPLVLPFAAANIKPQMVKPTPVKLMPAKLTEEQKPQPLSLEDNIEKNLRSFLQDTRDLEWDNVTVVELKRILRQYELNATGKKAELMQRIKKIRLSYQHLDGTVESERVTKTGIKRTESSPDTMGSDAGLDETTMGKSLDELFAGALEIPPGSEMLFS
ncbi:hypothetical protein PSACC_00874 [Paramicrosporidium saccamoebae]|uniref:SAP domain-containing protein n=1 Tax=Paramicrosporidium saccamoebae TaxID=1246581 RepID=A0A2H9TNM0_9FUNG|nr:hypothetical protein PSACC_00874 [Paramicrosporidium saccamoebae]